MIAITLGTVGLGLLAAPALASSPLLQLRPSVTARLLVASLATGAALVELSLVVTALPTVAHAAGAHDLAQACRHLALSSWPVLGWMAAALAVWLPLRVAVAHRGALRSARRAEVEPWLGEHSDHRGVEVVVLPTERLLALGVPSRPPQVVISQGVLDALGPEEAHALVEHEVAHHRLGHWRYLLVGVTCDRVAPGRVFERATRLLRDALERWADDEAANATPAGAPAMRRAVVAVAAAKVSRGRPRSALSTGSVLARVARLGDGRGRVRAREVGVLVPSVAAVTAGVVLLVASLAHVAGADAAPVAPWCA